MEKIKLNRIINHIPPMNHRNENSAFAFFRMLEENAVEHETVMEAEGYYFATAEQNEEYQREIDRFCLDSVLKRHKEGTISALWIEVVEDGESSVQDAYIDLGNGTVHWDINDWGQVEGAEDLVFAVYDEKTEMTYVIGTTEGSDTPEYIIRLLGCYRGYKDEVITDSIALTKHP